MTTPQAPHIPRRPLRHLIALAGLATLAVLLLPALAFAVPQDAEPEVMIEEEDVAPAGLYDAPVIEEEDLPPADSLNDEGELLIRSDRTNDRDDLLGRDSLLDDIDNEDPLAEDSVEVELEESSPLEAEMNALAGTDAPDLDYEIETGDFEADSYVARSTLPDTASPLPLLLAVGLLALSFALVMAIARFRRDDRNRALARSIATHEIDRRLHGVD